MPLQICVLRMNEKRAESAAEGFVLFTSEALIAEENYLMAEQRLPD